MAQLIKKKLLVQDESGPATVFTNVIGTINKLLDNEVLHYIIREIKAESILNEGKAEPDIGGIATQFDEFFDGGNLVASPIGCLLGGGSDIAVSK